jgi:hypothetical protein
MVTQGTVSIADCPIHRATRLDAIGSVAIAEKGPDSIKFPLPGGDRLA